MKGLRAPRTGPGRARPLAAFARAKEGASAVEFAIVAVPFVFLLIASLELSLIFVANTNLQNATFSAARQLRLGELVAPGKGATTSSSPSIDLTDFKAQICQNMVMVSASDCAKNLYLDVRELTGFNGTMAPSPFSNSTLDTTNFCFYSGASGSVVEFRAYYLWPIFTPAILSALVNTTTVTGSSPSRTGQWFTLSSFEVFRNEPGGATNTGAGC